MAGSVYRPPQRPIQRPVQRQAAGKSHGTAITRGQMGRLPATPESQEVDIPLLLITTVIGAALWVLSYFLHTSGNATVSMPGLIGLVFMLLGLFIPAAALVYSYLSGTYEENIVTGSDELVTAILALIVSTVLLLGAGGLFQWLYGLASSSARHATSYVFVIDDSGSMVENDPEQRRFSAIPSVLSGVEDGFPYMVYRFSDGVELTRAMRPASKDDETITGESNGGTAIQAVLTRVMDDYLDELWDGGAMPRVILLTDGQATDIYSTSAIDGLLREYNRSGISISTVGLGNVNRGLMEHISEKTGGVFIDVSDASQLSSAMLSAARRSADRDLVSARYTVRLGFLLGIMRVVFLTILGTGVGAFAAMLYGQSESFLFTTAVAALKSFVGALLLEIITGLFPSSEGVMWFILWLLISATVAMRPYAVVKLKKTDRVVTKAGQRIAPRR